MSRVVVNKPQPLEPQFAKERDRVQAAFGKRVREFRTERQLTLDVASRTIIWSLVKQVRVGLVPLFHRLHRRTALER